MGKDFGTISFIAGLMMGGIVGAAVGLMLAPEAGEATRERVRKAGNKLIKKSMDRLEDLNDSEITPAIERLSDQVKTGAKQIQKNISSRIKTV